MPTAGKLESALFAWAPKALAAEWDNVGLLVGDPGREVRRVIVALDATADVIDEAVETGAELIVSHHPIMNCAWHPVQTVRTDDRQGRDLSVLLRHDIAVICMHTNLDAARGGVNDVLAERLGLRELQPLSEDGIGRIGMLESEKGLAEFMVSVVKSLSCSGLRYRSAGKPVRKVAVGGGACGGSIPLAIAAGCDTFVTADLKYNDFLDHDELNLIDAGHFPTEDPVCEAVAAYLRALFPELDIVKSASHREAMQYYM